MQLTDWSISYKKKVNGSIRKQPNSRYSHADPALKERILAGHNTVLGQVEYFRENFGTAKSRWKGDGTRVTEVDETISRELFAELAKSFPSDDYCSEESAETPEPLPLSAEFAWVLIP